MSDRESQILQSEQPFRNIVQNSPMGMHLYELQDDDRLVFTAANPAADKLLKVDNRQFYGKTIEEVFPPLTQTEVPERYRLAARKGESWQTEQIIYQDGEIHGAFEVHAFQTSPGRMVAVFTDITARKQSEDRIRTSELALRQRKEELDALNLLSRAVNSTLSLETVCKAAVEKVAEVMALDTALLFILTDNELHLMAPAPQPAALPAETTSVHRPGECLCGLAAQSGQSVFSRNIMEDDRCTLHECINAGMHSFAAIPLVFDDNVLGVLGVGSMTDRDLEISARFLKTAADQLSIGIHNAHLFERISDYAVQLQQSIAEREHLDEQLRQAQKTEAIGQLTGGIAHDFNNILGGILGFTEMAMGQIETNPIKARTSMQRVLQAGNRAKDLVGQILRFSRQDAPEFTHLNLAHIVREVLNLMQAALPANIEIHSDIAPDPPKVRADASQLHQLVMNLCTNAFHAMRGSSGVLTITLDRCEFSESVICRNRNLPAGVYVRLKVGDTGHGITPENLKRIFDPYFTTKEKDEGTGLGLSVSLGIIDDHGGGIQVESLTNSGTTFSVYLPESASHVETKMPVHPEVPTGTERVLLVDDESLFTEMGMAILGSLGYHVTTASGSLEALDCFTRSPDHFDLIITDQTMPKMTGLELVERIKHLRPGIPAIICTGFSENIQTGAPQCRNISKILYKPYSLLDLATAIREVLNG